MLTISKPFLTNYKNYHIFESVFTHEECEYISSLAWKWNDALTQGAEKRVDKVRNADVFWLEPKQDLVWIWEKLKVHIEEANSHIWKFNLENFHENIQLTRYTRKGHYDWHIDNGNFRSSYRKISCVVNLTKENKYKGGGTLIRVGNKPIELSKKQGDLNLFPSYTLHKAKPVKRGERIVMVCWTGGEPFK